MLLKNLEGDVDHFLISCFCYDFGQQARVVKIHTDLKVGEFYGAKGVDHWSSTEWENQISEFEVCSFTKIRLFSYVYENCGVLYVSTGQAAAIWEVVRDLHKCVILFRFRPDFGNLAGYDDDTASLAQ